MKLIMLTQGQVSKVSDDKYEELSKHKWFAMWNPTTNSFYAGRNLGKPPHKTTSYMHREIMNVPDGFYVDHIDRDSLNNQTENLRICTNSQNKRNSKKYKNNQAPYKGVYIRGSRWVAKIRVNGALVHLGTWDSPEEAAIAYDNACIKEFEEYALLNFPIE